MCDINEIWGSRIEIVIYPIWSELLVIETLERVFQVVVLNRGTEALVFFGRRRQRANNLKIFRLQNQLLPFLVNLLLENEFLNGLDGLEVVLMDRITNRRLSLVTF